MMRLFQVMGMRPRDYCDDSANQEKWEGGC